MRAMVVYESMFGNTEQVARAIAQGIGRVIAEVECVEVGHAPMRMGAETGVLVVGGPTHAFGMSRPSTRLEAAKQRAEPIVSLGIGVREWLDSVDAPRGPIGIAAFDTHMDSPRVISKLGSASHPIERRLMKLGARRLMRAEHFWVADTQGPLREGELERARAWGESIASRAREVRVRAARG